MVTKAESVHWLTVEQPPASDWSAARVNRETGLTLEQLEYVERLCQQELVEIPAASTRIRQLSPRNLLLLALKWMRRYPAAEDLALEFGVSRRSVDRYVAHVLAILDTKLQYLRRWPRQHRSKILTGPLKGAIGAVDTFPICIPQPESKEDRKRFYIYKPAHKTRYGYKVQTFVDLHGRILDLTDAHPFGSKADITLFRESCVLGQLDPTTGAMAPSPLNLASRLESRIRNAIDESNSDTDKPPDGLDHKHSDPRSQLEEKKTDLIPNISEALSNAKALGDKAYFGSKLIYVPFKKFKGKRFTRAKKDFNRELSSKRVIVENVNKRLEDFKVLGTIYRGARDTEVVSRLCALLPRCTTTL